MRADTAGVGVFGIPRWPALPEITQGTSISDAGRAAAASADVGEFRFTSSALAVWPRTGVRYGPYAQHGHLHGHRTGPQGTPRRRRVRMRTHVALQIPKGPMARPLPVQA